MPYIIRKIHLQYQLYSEKILARPEVLLHRDCVSRSATKLLRDNFIDYIMLINIIYAAKKTEKMFFVSYNLPKDVQIMQEFVERKITDRLKPYLSNSDQTSK